MFIFYFIINLKKKIIVIILFSRYCDPNDVIKKIHSEPVPAYENWRESETIEKLESIRYSHNSLQMESLAIRERILGKFLNNCNYKIFLHDIKKKLIIINI